MKLRAVWEIPHRLEVTEGPTCVMRSCQVSPDTLSTMWPSICHHIAWTSIRALALPSL